MTDQTKTKIEEVKRLVLTGTPVKTALEKVGISHSSYYQTKRKLEGPRWTVKKRKPRSKITASDLPIVTEVAQTFPEHQKLFLFWGTPSQIAALLGQVQS